MQQDFFYVQRMAMEVQENKKGIKGVHRPNIVVNHCYNAFFFISR